jgi:hypothetical protein
MLRTTLEIIPEERQGLPAAFGGKGQLNDAGEGEWLANRLRRGAFRESTIPLSGCLFLIASRPPLGRGVAVLDLIPRAWQCRPCGEDSVALVAGGDQCARSGCQRKRPGVGGGACRRRRGDAGSGESSGERRSRAQIMGPSRTGTGSLDKGDAATLCE